MKCNIILSLLLLAASAGAATHANVFTTNVASQASNAVVSALGFVPTAQGGSATNAIGKTNGAGFGVTAVQKITATNITGGTFYGSLLGATNLSHTNIIDASTHTCSSNAFHVSGATTYKDAGGTPHDATAANGVYLPSGQNGGSVWTNTTSGMFFYFDALNGAWLIGTTTNLIDSLEWWFVSFVPCSSWPQTEWTDQEFIETYPSLGNFATNYSQAPLVSSNSVHAIVGSSSNSLFGKVVLRTNLNMDLKRDFGAVGDGSTDDSTAVQNAINYIFEKGAAIASNIRLYCPPGAYRLNSDINFPSQGNDGLYGGQIIAGAGSSSRGTVFIMRSTNCLGFNIASNCNDFIIEHILFQGPQASGSGGVWDWADTSSGIRVWNGTTGGRSITKFQIRNCSFQGFSTAILMTNAWNTLIRDCHFHGQTRAHVAMSGCHVTHIQDCLFDPTLIWDATHITSTAIWFQQDNGAGAGDDAIITSCEANGFTNAIKNDGDVAILFNGGHYEHNGALLVMTNDPWPITFKNTSIWDGPASGGHKGNYAAPFVVSAETFAMMTMEGVFRSDAEDQRCMWDIVDDPNNIGFHPPLVFGQPFENAADPGFKARWLGTITNRVYSIRPFAQGRKYSQAAYAFSNAPVNWAPFPKFAGDCDIVTSNGVLYVRSTTNGSGGVSTNWTWTNRISW